MLHPSLFASLPPLSCHRPCLRPHPLMAGRGISISSWPEPHPGDSPLDPEIHNHLRGHRLAALHLAFTVNSGSIFSSDTVIRINIVCFFPHLWPPFLWRGHSVGWASWPDKEAESVHHCHQTHTPTSCWIWMGEKLEIWIQVISWRSRQPWLLLRRTSGSATHQLLRPASRRWCHWTPGQRCTELSERREAGGRRTCKSGRHRGTAQASACWDQRNAPTRSPAHWGSLHRSRAIPVKMFEWTTVTSVWFKYASHHQHPNPDTVPTGSPHPGPTPQRLRSSAVDHQKTPQKTRPAWIPADRWTGCGADGEF